MILTRQSSPKLRVRDLVSGSRSYWSAIQREKASASPFDKGSNTPSHTGLTLSWSWRETERMIRDKYAVLRSLSLMDNTTMFKAHAFYQEDSARETRSSADSSADSSQSSGHGLQVFTA